MLLETKADGSMSASALNGLNSIKLVVQDKGSGSAKVQESESLNLDALINKYFAEVAPALAGDGQSAPRREDERALGVGSVENSFLDGKEPDDAPVSLASKQRIRFYINN